MSGNHPNAPVFYALADIRFNPVSQMGRYVGEFQDVLRREGFPDFSKETQTEIQVPRPGHGGQGVTSHEVSRWSFADAERRSGFLLLDHALIYHTTAYTRFTDFRRRLLKGLAYLHEQVELAYVERVGLRYLDAVFPADAFPLEDLLNPGLLGLHRELAGALKHDFSETVTELDGGMLVSRALITTKGLMLPPDLQPFSLILDERFRSQNEANGGRPMAVLDTDFFVQRRQRYQVDVIESQLLDAHGVLKRAFHAATVERARKELWKL